MFLAECGADSKMPNEQKRKELLQGRADIFKTVVDPF